MIKNKRVLPGNWYLAKMNPAKDDVSKILTVEIDDTHKLFKKNRKNGAAEKASI
jgi:hypothetical protein